MKIIKLSEKYTPILNEETKHDVCYDAAEATAMALKVYMNKKFSHYKLIDSYNAFNSYFLKYDKPFTYDMVKNIESRFEDKSVKIEINNDTIKIINI